MKSRIRSFGYAIEGLSHAIRSEPNLRFHLLATIAVIGAGCYFQVTSYDWLFIILAIGLVATVELLNTAIEYLCDHVTEEQHPMIKKVKDVSAGAVLLSAITALLVGIIIFGSKILELF